MTIRNTNKSIGKIPKFKFCFNSKDTNNNSKHLVVRRRQKSSRKISLRLTVRDKWRRCKLLTSPLSRQIRISISKKELFHHKYSPIKFVEREICTNKMTVFQWCCGQFQNSTTNLRWRDSPKLWQSRRTWDPVTS